MTLVSYETHIVLVNYKTIDLTVKAVVSVAMHCSKAFVTIVDNSEDQVEWENLCSIFEISSIGLSKISVNFLGLKLTLIKAAKNSGFGGGCNLALAQNTMTSKYIWFLNTDCLLTSNALDPLILAMEKEKYGLVSSLIYDMPDDDDGFTKPILQVSRVIDFLGFFRNISNHSLRQFDENGFIRSAYIYGASFLVKSADFFAVKGFDENYFMYLEETDLAFRIMKHTSKTCCFVPNSKVFHFGGASGKANARKMYLISNNYLYFVKKNYSGFKKVAGYVWYTAKLSKNLIASLRNNTFYMWF